MHDFGEVKNRTEGTCYQTKLIFEGFSEDISG